jgi:hypothetical protein
MKIGIYKELYKYDEFGNQIELSIFIRDKLNIRQVRKYNSKGTLEETLNYNSFDESIALFKRIFIYK